jgi:NDP-sugar pyrophosphorylase family protein
VSLPAVILVGGQGTRLRPLTERIRKDMLPLVDRPLLAFTFEHLRRYGVRWGIVSCGYLPTQIKEHFGERYGDLELTYRVEEEPLATATPSATRTWTRSCASTSRRARRPRSS